MLRPILFNKYRFLCVLTIVGVTGAFILPAHAQKEQSGFLGGMLNVSRSPLIEAGLAGVLNPETPLKHDFYDLPGMRAFYEDRGNSPLWLRGHGRHQPKAKTLLTILEESWTHGLNPHHYNVTEIRRLLDQPFGASRFELELLLSDSAIRYGRDLTGMRVDPRSIRQKSKYWRQPMRGMDILKHAARVSNVRKAFDRLAPQGKLYDALRQDLIRLAAEPEEAKPQKIRLNGILRPGDGHKKILPIRVRMGLDPEKALNGKYYYDDELAQAVMAFQKKNGLSPDGVIGTQTLAIMNKTRADRIRQVVVNLERLRWVEPDKPERYVLVNIPSATLWAVDGDDIELEMSVIVGKRDRATNIFKTEITGVRLNPTWTVPPTIKKVDFLPELKNDPRYLTNRGIEMYRGRGTVDPASIDWNSIEWQELNGIRMVQGPGRNNPLGKVRVIMPNPYNIYLHDTNKPHYFQRSNRALSSGCVRVSKPEELAMFILENRKGWSDSDMDTIFATGRRTDVMIDAPVPVYLLYQTVWHDDQGTLVYGFDVYGRDRKLASILEKGGYYALPKASIAAETRLPKKTKVEYATLNP